VRVIGELKDVGTTRSSSSSWSSDGTRLGSKKNPSPAEGCFTWLELGLGGSIGKDEGWDDGVAGKSGKGGEDTEDVLLFPTFEAPVAFIAAVIEGLELLL